MAVRDPMDCSSPGSSVHGILQVRILEWVAIHFSTGSSQPRDQSWVSHIASRFFTFLATRKAWTLKKRTHKMNPVFAQNIFLMAFFKIMAQGMRLAVWLSERVTRRRGFQGSWDLDGMMPVRKEYTHPTPPQPRTSCTHTHKTMQKCLKNLWSTSTLYWHILRF